MGVLIWDSHKFATASTTSPALLPPTCTARTRPEAQGGVPLRVPLEFRYAPNTPPWFPGAASGRIRRVIPTKTTAGQMRAAGGPSGSFSGSLAMLASIPPIPPIPPVPASHAYHRPSTPRSPDRPARTSYVHHCECIKSVTDVRNPSCKKPEVSAPYLSIRAPASVTPSEPSR